MVKMNEAGWIKLYRSIWSTDIWNIQKPFSERDAWIDILLLANHEDGVIIEGRKKKKIYRGQHKTSLRALSQRWFRSREWVKRYLNLLQDLGMVTVYTTTFGTLITVENYDVYQCSITDDLTTDKSTNKSTSKSAAKSTSKSQTRSKEVKEDKNNIEASPWGEKWQ